MRAAAAQYISLPSFAPAVPSAGVQSQTGEHHPFNQLDWSQLLPQCLRVRSGQALTYGAHTGRSKTEQPCRLPRSRFAGGVYAWWACFRIPPAHPARRWALGIGQVEVRAAAAQYISLPNFAPAVSSAGAQSLTGEHRPFNQLDWSQLLPHCLRVRSGQAYTYGAQIGRSKTEQPCRLPRSRFAGGVYACRACSRIPSAHPARRWTLGISQV